MIELHRRDFHFFPNSKDFSSFRLDFCLFFFLAHDFTELKTICDKTLSEARCENLSIIFVRNRFIERFALSPKTNETRTSLQDRSFSSLNSPKLFFLFCFVWLYNFYFSATNTQEAFFFKFEFGAEISSISKQMNFPGAGRWILVKNSMARLVRFFIFISTRKQLCNATI